MDEFINALRNGSAYDWISNHGWELSKDELITIIKEYEFQVDEDSDVHEKIAVELEDMM